MHIGNADYGTLADRGDLNGAEWLIVAPVELCAVHDDALPDDPTPPGRRQEQHTARKLSWCAAAAIWDLRLQVVMQRRVLGALLLSIPARELVRVGRAAVHQDALLDQHLGLAWRGVCHRQQRRPVLTRLWERNA